MALQTSYPDPAEIPEKYRELYTRSSDGSWVLSGIEGISPASEEYRNYAAYAKLGKTPGEIETLMQEHDKLKCSLSEANAKISEYDEKLRSGKIGIALRNAAMEKGVRPEAVSDVLARAANFEVDSSGQVITRIQGNAVSAAEWLEQQLKSSPHWLAPSRSAGIRNLSSIPVFHPSPASVSDLIHESWNNKRS